LADRFLKSKPRIAVKNRFLFMGIPIMLWQTVELKLVHLFTVEFYLFWHVSARILTIFLHETLAFWIVCSSEASPPLLDQSRLGMPLLQFDFPSGCLEDVAFGLPWADWVLLDEFAGGGIGAGLPES
jgi:hypothetical protein